MCRTWEKAVRQFLLDFYIIDNAGNWSFHFVDTANFKTFFKSAIPGLFLFIFVLIKHKLFQKKLYASVGFELGLSE